MNGLPVGLALVARATALRININSDGRLLPTKKRWRTSNKLCARRLLSAPCVSTSTSVQGVAISSTALAPTRFFAQMFLFPVFPLSFSLLPPESCHISVLPVLLIDLGRNYDRLFSGSSGLTWLAWRSTFFFQPLPASFDHSHFLFG